MCISGIGTLHPNTGVFYTHGGLWNGPDVELVCSNACVITIPWYITHVSGRFDLQPHTRFTLVIRPRHNIATLTVRDTVCDTGHGTGRSVTVGPAQLSPLADPPHTHHCTATSAIITTHPLLPGNEFPGGTLPISSMTSGCIVSPHIQ